MFKVLEKYHQILLKENMKAAPDKSHFFLTRVKFLGRVLDGSTITLVKSQIDKLNPHFKKNPEFLGKHFYKMQ